MCATTAKNILSGTDSSWRSVLAEGPELPTVICDSSHCLHVSGN